jgi:hypothetical protein
MNLTDLNDVPHKVQYITIDSVHVKPHTGTEPSNSRHTPMTLDLDLNSNIHFEGMTDVIGLKVVEAYFMQVGGSGTRDSGIARLIDIVCPQIPTAAQLLTTRGHILARCPLENNAVQQNDDYAFDKQAKLMTRKTNYFNPIAIKRLDFSFYQLAGHDTYQGLVNSREWSITLEITTIDTKEKPRNKDKQTLDALHLLIDRIDNLNHNVKKLPDSEELEIARKETMKYPFSYLVLLISLIIGGFMYMGRKASTPQPSSLPSSLRPLA